MEKITVQKITEIIIWIISYLPIVLVTVYRSLENKNNIMMTSLRKINNYIDINISVLVFLVILLFTVAIYKLTLCVFLRNIRKRITHDGSNKKLKIKSIQSLSINEYSFFILTLMLPFIFETFNSTFDILILFSLISILIYIMVKMEQIVVNPVFLFSNVKILQAVITKGHDKNIRECAIVTNLSMEQLETENFFNYEEYFNNVFFLTIK